RHGVDEAHLVGEVAEPREELRHPLPALAAGAETVEAPRQAPLLSLEGDELVASGEQLAVAALELGLPVPGVHLAHRARAEDREDALRARREVGRPRREGPLGADLRPERPSLL